MMLADLYTLRAKEESDIHEHLPRFVDLCVELEAKKVIELGVRSGVSTVGWLYGLEQTDGHLWSVDTAPAPDLPAERWTFIRGNDIDPDIVNQLPDNVDVVFIDTSHAADHTARELEAYLPKVRAGGRIVLHDTEVQHPDHVNVDPPFPVKTAIQQFTDMHRLFWSNHPNNNGLGIIEVTA